MLDAMDMLDYRVHAGARVMRQQSNVIGVIAGDLGNPFNAELAAEVEAQSASKGFNVLLASTGGVPEQEYTKVRTLLEHRVAALIFLAEVGKSAIGLVGDDIPVVFISGSASRRLSITVDGVAGTRLAVEHLTALGHRKIGFISAMLADEPEVENERYMGFRKGMANAGLEISPRYLLREHGTRRAQQATYRDLVKAYLQQEDRPTAIVAALDQIALEIMSVANELDIRIPEDLSLVGFDDIAISSHDLISLTTIRQPLDEFASVAIEAVMRFKPEEKWSKTENVMLPPTIRIRRTTRALHCQEAV
ncbi:hypothetical protein IT41_18485 [Paracoccus halophilus]|uniref:Transcriptional regulator LacI/GalR-like sensor domain-containing protein n=1 Tax=Paracoccus halophilus TaxID=376733 RepID=A0A099EV39_9RHOB|nr:hypothetical protein IT41_18485 [Paracoccus halophilus]